MLTASEIRRMTYDRTYAKGKQYYQEGHVWSVKIQWPEDPDTEDTKVTGEVRGSGRRVYQTGITVSPEDEIIGFSCDCPAVDSYWGMCKHCVALALEFQESQKKSHFGIRKVQKGIHRGTSEALAELLHRYSIQGRMNRLGGPDGEVGLECYFQSGRNNMILELRLGTKRKYVVKNIVKLVRDVQEVRDVQYGANLQFVHDRSAFTEEAREILTLLEQTVAGNYPDYQDGFYESASNIRGIPLRGRDLERFLTHFLGKTIRLDERDVTVEDRDPEVTMTLKETAGGAELLAEPLTVYEGAERVFVRKGQTICRTSPEFAEQVLPLWRIVQRGQGNPYQPRPLFLSEADYGTFCASVLPKLSEMVTIDSGNLDLTAYEPAEPEFTIWLEMPEEDVIEAAAKVAYDSQEYDLLSEEGTAVSGRSPERETEVRSILKKYFPEADAEREADRRKARKKSRIRDFLEWVDDVPVRDLDEDDGRGEDREYGVYADEYGLPVRDLDEEQEREIRRSESPEGLPQEYRRRYAAGEDAIYRLVDEGLPELSRMAEMLVDDTIRKLSIRPAPKVTMGIGIAGELIDLSVQVEGMDAAEISGILGAYRRRKKYYRLRSGDFIRVEENALADLSEMAEGLSLSDAQLSSGQASLPMYRALYLESVLRDSRDAHVRRDAGYRQLIRGMREYSESEFEIPEGLRAELRAYQRAGYRWLCTLCEAGFGGILADDMGLGKTLQMIALLLHRCSTARTAGGGQAAEDPEDSPSSLIVAPASLVYNWESEVQRFAPGLSVQVIAGTAAEREEQISRSGAYDLNITSYDLLKRDIEHYEAHSFDCCVADEAQYIKNAGTQAAKAVKQVAAAHRFALTGTPIENRLSDLWSIFDFLMPGYLFSYHHFREELEAPIVKNGDEVANRRLQRMVTPFILRRRKGDVLKDLPDKLEETVTVRMTPEQERVYRASTERIRLELMRKSEQEVRESRLQILSELTRLRQLCCSPELCYENYSGGSGKVDTCLELLNSAVEGGHRVLVFSQFTSMLELLQKEWEKQGGTYLYLSGKDSKLSRKKMVEEFQAGGVPVFFISLKAGGTGLNLTAADIVIHVDPWWNVAAQNQATDRAHRIGQRHVVNVMKLVAKNTIEEKILKLQEKKAALADSVVEGEGVQDTTLNKEELLSLFD